MCFHSMFRSDDVSKKAFEVLRLGSGEQRSTDPRTSITIFMATRHGLCI